MQMDRPDPILSPREHQLLRLAAAGFTDMAIAEQLGISEATVGTYWGRVRIKFGPYSRTELVAIMMRAENEATLETLRLENASVVSELQIQLSSGTSLSSRTVLENAPDSILLVSTSGIIEFANEAAQDMFGYGKDEMEGLEHNLLVPVRLRDRHAEMSQEYIRDPGRRSMGIHMQTPALHKNGLEFSISATLSAIESSTGPVVMCVVRNSAAA